MNSVDKLRTAARNCYKGETFWEEYNLFCVIADEIEEEIQRKLIKLPTDIEGEVLDVGDTVHMLQTDHNGDHEWDDVIIELVYCKYGGDAWIVRGARGDAWACECEKTGHDDELYDNSDWELLHTPWDDIEQENDRLQREIAATHAGRSY